VYTYILHHWWAIIVAIGVIIGLLAGIQQLWSWAATRGQRRAEERVLEIAAQQLNTERVKKDAEQAKKDAERYEMLRADLRSQVEREVPREARRVYLINRMDRLAASLSSDLEEYETIEQELRSLSGRSASPLDERVRAVVRGTILPSQEQRQRRERLIFVLLVVLVVLSFSPITPIYLIQGYFHVLGSSEVFSVTSIALALFFGLIVLATVFRISCSPLSRHLRSSTISSLNRLRWPVAVVGPILGAGAILWAFYWRQRAALQDLGAHGASVYASICFHVGVILLAIGIATLSESLKTMSNSARRVN
jgi:predicted nucleic acid-binding Zn ribbon protein